MTISYSNLLSILRKELWRCWLILMRRLNFIEMSVTRCVVFTVGSNININFIYSRLIIAILFKNSTWSIYFMLFVFIFIVYLFKVLWEWFFDSLILLYLYILTFCIFLACLYISQITLNLLNTLTEAGCKQCKNKRLIVPSWQCPIVLNEKRALESVSGTVIANDVPWCSAACQVQ